MEEHFFLSNCNGGDFLFTPKGIPSSWKLLMITEEIILPKDSKKTKDLFTQKKQKKGINYFVLGKEYGIYSFRHTFITKILP